MRVGTECQDTKNNAYGSHGDVWLGKERRLYICLVGHRHAIPAIQLLRRRLRLRDEQAQTDGAPQRRV
jgi:N-dimethylarginine dimethylaminohydrolase